MSTILTSASLMKVPGVVTCVSSSSETQLLDSAGSLAKVVIPGPISKVMDGRPFKVKAYGRAEGQSSATTLTLIMYYGVSGTIGSNTAIVTSTARAITNAKHNFYQEALLMWDNTTQKLQGVGMSMIANLVDTTAALSNIPTSVDFSTEGLGFTITGTMSTSHANNKAYLLGFEVELL